MLTVKPAEFACPVRLAEPRCAFAHPLTLVAQIGPVAKAVKMRP
jgi:hypothetical protein